MSLIAKLEQDHHQVLEELGLLTVSLQELEAKAVGLVRPTESLTTILDVFKNKLPEHFNLEERILFPLLEKFHLYQSDMKPFISELLSEHEKIRKDIAAFLADVGSPQVRPESLASSLTRIAENLSAHARKEDQKLLPLARRLVDEGKLGELDRLMSEMRRTQSSTQQETD